MARPNLMKLFALDAVVGETRRTARPLAQLLQAARPRRDAMWLSEVDDAGERFDHAMSRYGRDERDLDGMLRGLYRRFSIYIVAISLFAAWAVLVSGGWATKYGPFGGLMPFAGLPAFIALAVQSAFFHWQIRTRRLGRLGEWLRQPAEWIPLGAHRPLFSLLFLLFATSPAFAATTGPGQDLAQNALNGLFPMFSGSGGASALSNAIYVVTGTLMGLAIGAIIYESICAVADAAHTGEALRNGKYHGAYGFSRVAFGMAMLAPIISGFSGVHGALFLAGTKGNSVANDVWSTYVSSVLGTTSAATSAPGIPPSIGGAVLAEEILDSEVCADLSVAAAQISGATTTAAVPATGGTAITSSSGITKQVWSWGGTCGGLTLPVPPSSAPAALAAFSITRIAAVGTLIDAVRSSSVATQIANWKTLTNGSPAFPTEIQAMLATAGQAYDQSMLSAAATLSAQQNANVRSKLQAAANAGGWTQAFAFDRALGQASAQTAEIAAEAPKWAAPKDDDETLTSSLAALSDEL